MISLREPLLGERSRASTGSLSEERRNLVAKRYKTRWQTGIGINEVWPHYDEYAKRTAREIPVVVLERV